MLQVCVFINHIFHIHINTVKLLIRLAGLILFLRLKVRALLEKWSFCLLNLRIIAGLIRIRVLLESEPYLKFYGRCHRIFSGGVRFHPL